eukprot:6124145-Pleurochrysis_carterae.AAC.1
MPQQLKFSAAPAAATQSLQKQASTSAKDGKRGKGPSIKVVGGTVLYVGDPVWNKEQHKRSAVNVQPFVRGTITAILQGEQASVVLDNSGQTITCHGYEVRARACVRAGTLVRKPRWLRACVRSREWCVRKRWCACATGSICAGRPCERDCIRGRHWCA